MKVMGHPVVFVDYSYLKKPFCEQIPGASILQEDLTGPRVLLSPQGCPKRQLHMVSDYRPGQMLSRGFECFSSVWSGALNLNFVAFHCCTLNPLNTDSPT
jgi:hypothetical protein